MTTTVPRTLIFGLDGFDFDHARRLVRAGHLPWLGARLSSGSFVETHCPVLPGSEWVNAATGVDASHHGYLHTSQIRVGSYEDVAIDASVVRSDPFYLPLVRAGHKCVVVDLCVDRPRPQDNLVQVIDWATEFKLWHYATTPRSVRSFVRQRVGQHPLTDYPGTDPAEARLIRLHQELLDGTRQKGQLVRHLMDAHPDWQVFFAGFCECHKAGHFLWQFQDADHPGYAGPSHPLAGALDASYIALDRELQETAEAAGEGDLNIVLVADRGMRANLRGDHLIEPLLVRLGLLSMPGGGAGAGSTAPTVRSGAAAAGRSWKRTVKEHIPVALRPWLRSLLGQDRYDWRHTSVFPVPDVGNSYLRLNLCGREPAGTVRADQYDATLELLAHEFKSLVNPDSGTCPVREIVYPQRDARGALREWLPDIGVVWRCDAPVKVLCSPNAGRLEGSWQEQRSGNHSEQGGLLFCGPDFAAGNERIGDLRELAPTVLQLSGVDVPGHYAFPPAPEVLRNQPGRNQTPQRARRAS